MTDDEFAQFVDELETAQSALLRAHVLVDGIEGWTPAAEHSWSAAMASIDAIRAAEVAGRIVDEPEEHVENA